MSEAAARPQRAPRDLTWVVALAACLWGTSAIFRDPLAGSYDAATLVMYEHLILVLVLLPWLLPALRAWRRAPVRVQLAAAMIGAGSSALATTLFTAAFRLGDPITPQILQKMQPVVAVVLAAVLLRERLRPRYLWFAVPALIGAWLTAFPDPLSVRVADAQAALLALGAASLWAGGTVFGRFVDGHVGPRHTLVLRFAFGLPAAAIIVAGTGSSLTLPAQALPQVALLALIPGLAALALYYVGLQHTPASRATLAELMFPVTAAVVGVSVLGGSLVWSQWLGSAVIIATVTALAWNEIRGRRPAVIQTRPLPASAGNGGGNE